MPDCPPYPLYAENKVFLAQAYVPIQIYARRFPLDVALQKGSLFPELCRSLRLVKKDC